MCLGVPGQIIAIADGVATVDFWGVERSVRLDRLETVPERGEYIVEHGGYAVRIIPVEQVADTLGMYELVLVERGEDPLVGDMLCNEDDSLLAKID